jgi:hypothetical protein
LTRGRVCRLLLLLALASAVIFGTESHGTRGHILLSQIRDFPFRRLLLLAGLWWRSSTKPVLGESSLVLCYYRRSVGQSVWLSSTHLWFTTRFLLLSDNYRFVLWGALSDERMGFSFTFAAGPCQRSHFLIPVSWDSRPYSTIPDLRLSFLSPPTTRRVTVEVFDPPLAMSPGYKPSANRVDVTSFNRRVLASLAVTVL